MKGPAGKALNQVFNLVSRCYRKSWTSEAEQITQMCLSPNTIFTYTVVSVLKTDVLFWVIFASNIDDFMDQPF